MDLLRPAHIGELLLGLWLPDRFVQFCVRADHEDLQGEEPEQKQCNPEPLACALAKVGSPHDVILPEIDRIDSALQSFLPADVEDLRAMEVAAETDPVGARLEACGA